MRSVNVVVAGSFSYVGVGSMSYTYCSSAPPGRSSEFLLYKNRVGFSIVSEDLLVLVPMRFVVHVCDNTA